ncbi:MAG: NifB/NifX family molybdenum-iron cluster-binding protein [Bacteroidota bacterium]|nr:NifB/NifX family molybdenum-iron cluster-binding protein [Bacteroidota bacterium]
MKIAAALTENHPKSVIDEHFGRCDWYGIYDTETREIHYVENPNRYVDEGAGCSSAQMLMDYHIDIAIAGRFGAKVAEFFKKNNVQMIIPEKNKKWDSLLKLINH